MRGWLGLACVLQPRPEPLVLAAGLLHSLLLYGLVSCGMGRYRPRRHIREGPGQGYILVQNWMQWDQGRRS